MDRPVVVMDEAGNTGENLLDADQPIYTLAAVRIDVDVAQAAVENARNRAKGNARELKFSSLRGSSGGRKNILALLDEVALGRNNAAVIVVHKRSMIAAKIVDELIEPRMLAKGIQAGWYASGAARNMALALAELAPRHLGELYEELERAFVGLVRNYSDEGAEWFLSALARCKLACRRNDLYELLSVMVDSPEELAAEFSGRADALDPALTSLFWQAGHWSDQLATRFEIVHDESTAVARWQSELFEPMQGHLADRTEPESFEIGAVTIHLPTLLDTITFRSSHADPRIQIADLLAGSATHWYAAYTAARPDREDFASKLRRAGVPDLIREAIGPEAAPARPRG